MKNEIHSLLTAPGMKDIRASLQSKRGRLRVLDALNERVTELVVQPLFYTTDRLEESVKGSEAELAALTENDRAVELLQTIPGCGPISAWTIRAYTDDIKRFQSAKKYAAYASLVPYVPTGTRAEFE